MAPPDQSPTSLRHRTGQEELERLVERGYRCSR
jgi:hypothetical protein